MIADEQTLLPSPEICQRASQTWARIKKRFELSSVWRLAPPEVIATEFISVLRFALAPLRIEAALYDHSCKEPLLAATLPNILAPTAGDSEIAPHAFEFATTPFFAWGGAAARRWMCGLPSGLESRWAAIASSYGAYLATFREPQIIPLNSAGSLRLHLLVDRPYADERVESFIKDMKLAELLRAHHGNGTPGKGEWQLPNRRLTDYLLDEFLDRLENELAILIDGHASDIWVLLPNESGDLLKFHAPRPKLSRLLEQHGMSEDTDLSKSKVALVGNLRRRVEGEGMTGELREYLAPCQSGYHQYLSSKWTDGSQLSVEHLECIAEKFQGWPVDRGIAASVVATGCSDVVRDFAKDYRVKAYSYEAPPTRLPGESEAFYRVRLAERVFITISPHAVEIPMLWGIDMRGRGRCAALLLVLFNGHDPGSSGPDYFAQRALAIRDAVEPWYLLFEHHGQSTEWNRVIRGHIVHEAKSAFAQIENKLDAGSRSRLQTRLDLLWSAYTFIRDDRGPARTFLSMTEFADLVKRAADRALGPSSQFGYAFLPEGAPEVGEVEIPKDLFHYLLTSFLERSAATLDNLATTEHLGEEDDRVLFRISVGNSSGHEIVLLDIVHGVTPGVAEFIKQHGTLMGRLPVFTQGSDNRKRAHQGLFLMGVILRGCGGEFMRPVLHECGKRVTWSFGFPLHRRIP